MAVMSAAANSAANISLMAAIPATGSFATWWLTASSWYRAAIPLTSWALKASTHLHTTSFGLNMALSSVS